MEKPVVFMVGTQQVVGMLHMPERRRGRAPAVLFLHGFTGTKVESHRIFVKTARALAHVGIASLRFDFRGSGDSGGEFSSMTLAGELKDARAALRFLRRRPGIDPARIGLLGMSMGAAVGSVLLGEDARIPAAALWSPVSHPDRVVEAKLTPEARKDLRRMGVTDHHGYAVGQAFVAEVKRHKPLKAIAKTRAAVLLIHGDRDETVPAAASDAYEAALRKTKRAVVKHVVRGADHTYNTLAWETEVVALTFEWFRLNLL